MLFAGGGGERDLQMLTITIIIFKRINAMISNLLTCIFGLGISNWKIVLEL